MSDTPKQGWPVLQASRGFVRPGRKGFLQGGWIRGESFVYPVGEIGEKSWTNRYTKQDWKKEKKEQKPKIREIIADAVKEVQREVGEQREKKTWRSRNQKFFILVIHSFVKDIDGFKDTDNIQTV